MIEALKDDDLVRRVGGKFRLTSLIQKRWAQLIDGARPLVERQGRSDLEVVVEEIRLDRITYESVAGSGADADGKARAEPEATL